MRLDLDREAGVGAAGPGQLAPTEPPVGVSAERDSGQAERAVGRGDHAVAAKSWRGQVDAALVIAEIGGARGIIETAALLVETMHRSSDLGHEGSVLAPD